MKTPNTKFYDSPLWKKTRYKALSNRKQCEICRCGGVNVQLHVRHIAAPEQYPELAHDPGNLEVLCDNCLEGQIPLFTYDQYPR